MSEEKIIPQIEWERYVAARDKDTRFRKKLIPDDENNTNALRNWRIIRELESEYYDSDLELRYQESLNRLKEDMPELYAELT